MPDLAGSSVALDSVASTTGLNVTMPVYSGYASARSMQIAAAGGTYTFGNLGIGLVYSNTRFQDIGTETGTGLNPNNIHGTATFNTGKINAAISSHRFSRRASASDYTQGSSIDGCHERNILSSISELTTAPPSELTCTRLSFTSMGRARTLHCVPQWRRSMG